VTCDCLKSRGGPPPALPWEALRWHDERNAERFTGLLEALATASPRHGDRMLHSMIYFPDAPALVLPSDGLWMPERRLIFGNELVFAMESLRLGDTAGFAKASAGESKSDATPPCEPCTQKLCGPNVTSQVTAAVTKTKTTFATWPSNHKEGACSALQSTQDNGSGQKMAAVAWDINDLHHQEWIALYDPCGKAPCQNTVQVGDQCYYAGSVNYVIFGVMCKLCADYYGWRGLNYSETAALVYAYKGHIPGVRSASGNYQISQDWAKAGYEGWPTAKAPSGDRPNCTPTCPKGYAGTPFTVNWHWLDSSGGRTPVPTGDTF
jgi:hypothetical protein